MNIISKLKSINKKSQKKGSVLIESILVIPFLIILVFMMLQIFLYYYANNVMNTSTNDAANSASYELRGNPILIESFGQGNLNFVDGGKLGPLSNDISDTINNRISEVTKHNTLILFGKNDKGDNINLKDNVDFFGSEETCNQAIKDKNNTRVTCAYVYSKDGSGDGSKDQSYQIVVRSKAPYKILGNFFGVLGGGENEENSKFFVYGNASSPIEMPGRFNYFE